MLANIPKTRKVASTSDSAVAVRWAADRKAA